MKLFLFSLFLFQTVAMQAAFDIDSVLQVLDVVIDRRQEYYQEKEFVIHNLKNRLKQAGDNKERYLLYTRLFDEYVAYQYDSAYHYAVQTQELASVLTEKVYKAQADCNLFYCYLSTGMFREAYDMMTSIRVDQMPDSLKSNYYQLCMRLFSDMSSYTEGTPFNAKYNQMRTLYCDSALLYTPAPSFLHEKIEAFKFNVVDDTTKIKMYKKMLSEYDVSAHEQAIVYSMLGRVYSALGDQNGAIYYMALSSIADVVSATRETTAKKELAGHLYMQGDLMRASRYIQIALEEANSYNARLRKMEINSILPIIERQRLILIEDQRKDVLFFLVLSCLLSVLLLAALFVIYKQMKRLGKAKLSIQRQFNLTLDINAKLQESNAIKDQYIFQSLYGKSEYLDKIENLLKKQERKLKARQFNELQIIHKEFDIKSERENMYSSFDHAFLQLFPNFLDEYNKFFLPEDQVSLDERGNLSPEVRIFALIRLGVNENERIAKFLNLSINTIYVYKAKVKAKTILPKGEFEQRVLAIKKI